MTTLNDIIFHAYPDRGYVLPVDLAMPATDAEIEAHLASRVWEKAMPTLAEIRAAESARATVIERQAALATKKEIIDAVQAHLDSEAQQHGYDNIVSACSYASVPNTFQAEAISFLVWRSAVWSYCYRVLDDVTNGGRAVPAIAELLSELPAR